MRASLGGLPLPERLNWCCGGLKADVIVEAMAWVVGNEQIPEAMCEKARVALA